MKRHDSSSSVSSKEGCVEVKHFIEVCFMALTKLLTVDCITEVIALLCLSLLDMMFVGFIG